MFVTSFAALASLVKVFKARCTKIIEQSVDANEYLLSVTEKPPTKTSSASTALLLNELEAGQQQEEPSLVQHFLEGFFEPPPFTPHLVLLNKFAWTLAGMISDVMMSTLLYVAMLLRLATFRGAIEDVALILISLYFVFDLQVKILETNPKIKMVYQRAVLDMTEKYESRARDIVAGIVKRIAAVMLMLVSLSGSLGLIFIVLVSWLDTADERMCVIGVDPFRGVPDCGGI
jgi:hypothetical protein